MSNPLRIPLTIGLLLLTMGASDNGCIATLEVEVESVCVTRAVEVGPTDGTTASASFTIDDFGSIGELAAKDGEMYFTEIVLRPAQGTLGEISSGRAAISSADPSSTLPTLEMMCSGHCIDADGTVSLPAGVDADAVAYVTSGAMVIELAVTGELPTQAWTMNVDVCMVGRFGVSI